MRSLQANSTQTSRSFNLGIALKLSLPELWQDFITQAKSDMKRAKRGFDEQDYGAAAEDTQHALEVFLKAYLMRYNLIASPTEVNHLKLVNVLMKVQARADAIVTRFSKSKKFVIPLGKAKREIKRLGEILAELQPRSGKDESEEMKIKLELWKHSLGIEVTPEYERHLKELDAEIKARIRPMMDDFMDYYNTEIRPILDKISDTAKESAAEKYAKDSGFHTQIMADVIRGNPPAMKVEDSYLYMIVLLMFLEKLFKEEIKNSEWEFYRQAKEVYLLTYPFRFFDTIIKTFPHQDIGRYPNRIEEESTLQLYKKYSPQLGILMAKVEEDCIKIENAIYGRWNNA